MREGPRSRSTIENHLLIFDLGALIAEFDEGIKEGLRITDHELDDDDEDGGLIRGFLNCIGD